MTPDGKTGVVVHTISLERAAKQVGLAEAKAMVRQAKIALKDEYQKAQIVGLQIGRRFDSFESYRLTKKKGTERG